MSTFTNILQQKINNLEAQIRQLQEQNAHLRNKARWLMEAAASSDMSMLSTVQNEPMGQYTGANPNSTYTAMGGLPQQDLPYDIPSPDTLKPGQGGEFTSNGDKVDWTWNGRVLIVRIRGADGTYTILQYVWNGTRYVPVGSRR